MKKDAQIPWGKYKVNEFVVISLIRSGSAFLKPVKQSHLYI